MRFRRSIGEIQLHCFAHGLHADGGKWGVTYIRYLHVVNLECAVFLLQ